MTLKEILDKLTELVRLIQYSNHSKEDIIKHLQQVMEIVGQTLVQKETINEELRKSLSNIWMTHIKGSFDCPHCNKDIVLDFFIGSKGASNQPLIEQDKGALLQKLQFPPITSSDLRDHPIPDFLPPNL